jgi:hypothetical protein
MDEFYQIEGWNQLIDVFCIVFDFEQHFQVMFELYFHLNIISAIFLFTINFSFFTNFGLKIFDWFKC